MSTSPRKQIPDREKGIAQRLKTAREHLRLSQAEFAAQLGITRQRLANYEDGRAPLRFDLALRLCRQFILSEKWLANGDGVMRQCLDLNSRGASYQVAVDMPFGAAYDAHLGQLYDRVEEQSPGSTQLLIHDTDLQNPAFFRNYFMWLIDLWFGELPKQRHLPEGYAQNLFVTLSGVGLDFVEWTIEHNRLPMPDELLEPRLKAWRELQHGPRKLTGKTSTRKG